MRDPVRQIRDAVVSSLAGVPSPVLAVSGGMDSCVLLDAAFSVLEPAGLIIATFDHRTGAHSAAAVDHVSVLAMTAGATVIVGGAAAPSRPSEEAWRRMRLDFLTAVVAERRGTLVTAHHRDDQVETVLFREMRGAGARGLAGLRAPGPVRPLLAFSRIELATYAAHRGLRWVEDPSNLDLAFSRNRIRHELLPALARHAPWLPEALFDIGERAADWRRDVDAAVDSGVEHRVDRATQSMRVDAGPLAGRDPEVLAVIWPALLARLGIAADRRGTRRVVEFTSRGVTGQRIQLSGGWVVYRRRGHFEVRRGDG